MFTSITLSPKSVALFVAREVRTAAEYEAIHGGDRVETASDLAIDLVDDLARTLDFVCESGRIAKLSDNENVEFRFQSDGNAWIGTLWVSVYDDLPGCPCEVNLSIHLPDPADTSDYPEDLRYESFEVATVSGYSRSDVAGIKVQGRNAEIVAYVKGYDSGKTNAETNASGNA